MCLQLFFYDINMIYGESDGNRKIFVKLTDCVNDVFNRVTIRIEIKPCRT